MIFAAGLGTRLYPLTIDRPKALVEVAGKTLLQWAIEKVAKYGYHEIVINVHHFGGQIIDFLNQNNNFGLKITISDERKKLLDTGGAILKAAPLLQGDEPFLIYNVDVLSDINLLQLLDYHIEKRGLATLVVRERKTSRYLSFDESMRLGGWRNITSGEEIISRAMDVPQLYAFSGIQLVDPAIFKLITEKGCFPLVPLYTRLSEKYPIIGYRDTSSLWMDMGKPDQLKVAEKLDFDSL